MENNFLLTYSFVNTEGMSDRNYHWYESEEEMREDIEFKREIYKDFKIIETIKILDARDIEI